MIRPMLAGTASIAASLVLLAVLITATNMVTEIEEDQLSKIEPQVQTQEDVNCSSTVDLPIFTFLPTGTGCILESDTEILRFRFKAPASIPDFSLSPEIKSSFSGAFVTLRFADGASSWNFLSNRMNDEQRSFAEGRLNYLVEELFGTEISLEQSITSMLGRPSTIYIGNNSSGNLIVALEGMMEKSKILDKKLKDLHIQFKSNASKAIIKERDLEGRFNSRDVRVSNDNFIEKESKFNQWKIHTILSGPRTFVTAKRGSMFVMSNDENALKEILEQSISITPPSVSSMTTSLRIADGIFDLEKLDEALSETPFSEIIKIPYIESGDALWSLEKGENTSTLSIQTD